jgi:hypothetical protein
MLDRGICLPSEDVRQRINDGTLFDWLQGKFGLDMDISLHTEENLSEMLKLFQQFNNTVNSKKKMGVELNGISLLLAFSIEGIQQGK